MADEDAAEPEQPAPSQEELAAQEKAIGGGGKAPIVVRAGRILPDTLAALYRLAEGAIMSGLLPKGIRTPAAAVILMQRGAELGFPGLTAFEFLYVTNGKPTLTPAGAKAVALASGLLEDFREQVVGEGENMEAVVTVRRRGIASPIERRFSVKDAQTARLWGKTGKESGKPSAWVTHPKRMLLARARGFAFQDAFPDLCGGLQIRERFDLEPGEELGATVPSPVRPKTGADPIFARLGAGPAVNKPEEKPRPEPIEAEFCSHAEADKAIADSEK